MGAESAVDINLAKQLNVLITQMGVDGKNVAMNVGSAAAGYGFEYVVSTLERVKAAALRRPPSWRRPCRWGCRSPCSWFWG